MKTGKLKAAVVGLGIGMAHAAGYMKSARAELSAVCDLIPERRSSIGGTFHSGSMLSLKSLFSEDLLEKSWEEIGVSVYTDLGELLADPSIDIVSICTPDYLHADHAVKVLKSGKHLLLEKPLDISLDAAVRVLKEVHNTQAAVIGIGFEFRVNPAIEKLKELAAGGELGEIRAFSLHHFRTPFRDDKWQNWIEKRETSGGLIVEETCHWIDLAMFITGKDIKDVQSVTDSSLMPQTDFEDTAFIQGHYCGGGVFQLSHILTGFDFDLQLIVQGTKKTAWCRLKDAPVTILDNYSSSFCGIVCCGSPDARPEQVKTWIWNEEATEPENIRDMVVRFTESVASGTPPSASLEEGMEALKWSLKASGPDEQ